MSTVSTHVLDTVLGRPAAGVPVRLEQGRRAGTGRGRHQRRRAGPRAGAGRSAARQLPRRLRHRRLLHPGRAAGLLPGGRDQLPHRRRGRSLSRAARPQPVRLLDLPRELTVGIILGANQYGKAEIRVVRIYRDTPRHEIHDLSTSPPRCGVTSPPRTCLVTRPTCCPPTPRKTPCSPSPSEHGVGQIEDFALDLARHFVETVPAVTSARVGIDEYAWDRVAAVDRRRARPCVRPARPGRAHHGGHGRRDRATAAAPGSCPGFKDLVVLKSTGSEFRGFFADRYTTLAETDDRILATSLIARWRYAAHRRRLGACHAGIRAVCWTPSPAAQPRPAADPAGHGHGGAEGPSRGRRDQASPRRTSTTSSPTWRRSGWITRARCSTRRTGPTG